MKTGMTLTQLATELERQRNEKQDFIAPTNAMRAVVSTGPEMQLRLDGHASLPVNAIAHSQLAEYLDIPKAYYDRCKDKAPGLLADQVNRWLPERVKDQKYERRMIRTLDGNVRAILSDSYRSLENSDLAEAVLPVLMQQDLVIASCQVTERKLYIKAYSRDLERQVPTGASMGVGHVIFDTISPAIIISNSEVGYGRLSVEHGVYTKACTNLASWGTAFKRTHIGGRADESDEVYAMLSDQTKRLADAAIWSKVKDVVAGALSAANFEAKVLQLGNASERRITSDPIATVERIGKQLALTGEERKSVLQCLIQGASLSQYGVSAAITRMSQQVESYDRASELERLGGEVIELPATDWARLAEAA